jgi:hypothetical protein
MAAVNPVLTRQISETKTNQHLIPLALTIQWQEYILNFSTIEESILRSVVKKLIKLKFYVQLTGVTKKTGHAVTIVDIQGDNYIIKNSWNELVDIVPSIKFFYLKGRPIPFMGVELLIYIPIISSEPPQGVGKGEAYNISAVELFDIWLNQYDAEITSWRAKQSVSFEPNYQSKTSNLHRSQSPLEDVKQNDPIHINLVKHVNV